MPVSVSVTVSAGCACTHNALLVSRRRRIRIHVRAPSPIGFRSSGDWDSVRNQQIHFMKNVAIIGGLLGLLAHGSGRIAFDRK